MRVLRALSVTEGHHLSMRRRLRTSGLDYCLDTEGRKALVSRDRLPDMNLGDSHI